MTHCATRWLAIVLGHLTRASLSVLVFRRGRWRDIEIRLGEAAEGEAGAG